MSKAALTVFVVTIRRGENYEPETYYMPAPTASSAVLRVRRLAKAPKAAVMSIETEMDWPLVGAEAVASGDDNVFQQREVPWHACAPRQP